MVIKCSLLNKLFVLIILYWFNIRIVKGEIRLILNLVKNNFFKYFYGFYKKKKIFSVKCNIFFLWLILNMLWDLNFFCCFYFDVRNVVIYEMLDVLFLKLRGKLYILKR